MATSKTAKQNLKTMSKNTAKQKLRSTSRIFKYGTISFTRNIWLSIAATLVMTITLLILFITVIASGILASTADVLREKIDITIYFKPTTSSMELSEMADTMSADPNVKSVEISTSEEEYQKIVAEYSDNEKISNLLNEDAMRELTIAGTDAAMRIKVFDVNDLTNVKNIVSGDRAFLTHADPNTPPSYDDKRAQIETITNWANIARNSGIILSIVFLGISVLVIFNTIRMAIFSRREEIYMMKLVGADNHFIRGPFLIEAQICGVISGIIAATLGYVGFHTVSPQLASYGINIAPISNILETNWLFVVYLIIILIGFLIGTISSSLAIRRYLNATAKRTKHKKKRKK